MDFKQYLKESLTSLGEGASDIQRALIDFSKTYRPMYANEQVDETLNPREDWQKKTPDLDKQVKGLLELPMAVGAPLTPKLSGMRLNKNLPVNQNSTHSNIEILPPTRDFISFDGAKDDRVSFYSNNNPIRPKIIEPDTTNSGRLLNEINKPYSNQIDMPIITREFEELTDTQYNTPMLPGIRDKYGFKHVTNSDFRSEQTLDEALGKLSEVTGLPPEALGLRGDLTLRMGEVHPSHPNAHGVYQQGSDNIYISPGHDALGHEWFHALDRYIGKYFGKEAGTKLDPKTGIPQELMYDMEGNRMGTQSHSPPNIVNETRGIDWVADEKTAGRLSESDYLSFIDSYATSAFPNMRPELRDKWKDVLGYVYHPDWTNTLTTSDPNWRSYVSRPTERGARLFESWLQYRSKTDKTPMLNSGAVQKSNRYDDLPLDTNGRPNSEFIKKAFDSLDAFFNEIRVRGATRSDGQRIVELFGGAAPLGMLVGMPDKQTQKKATPPKDITKGWTSPFDEEDKKFIDRPLDTLKEKRGPSKLWDDYWSSQLPGQSPNQR